MHPLIIFITLLLFCLPGRTAADTPNGLNKTGCSSGPQLRNDLKVLHESPPFITAFFLFRPTWRSETRERIEDAVLNLHTTPGGQQVLTVFQSSGMTRQPSAVLDDTRQFILEYRQLTNKFAPRETQP